MRDYSKYYYIIPHRTFKDKVELVFGEPTDDLLEQYIVDIDPNDGHQILRPKPNLTEGN